MSVGVGGYIVLKGGAASVATAQWEGVWSAEE